MTPDIPEDAVLRRDGQDCTFYYREQNGRLVERAVFDDGRIGDVYQAGGEIDPESDDVDVLEADAWPTSDESQLAASGADRRPGDDGLRADGAGVAHRGQKPWNHDLPATDNITRFQVDLLRTIEAADAPKGTAIKARLEELYDDQVHHGRVYPNLDGLATDGLITKRQRDKRTNEYDLTDRGEALLDRRREWLGDRGGDA